LIRAIPNGAPEIDRQKNNADLKKTLELARHLYYNQLAITHLF
jgi:hypothetical protein